MNVIETALREELANSRAELRKLAVYCFTRYGHDAYLYNSLADLAGMPIALATRSGLGAPPARNGADAMTTRQIASPAAGRILPPMPRDADAPQRDGRLRRACLAALEQAYTVGELSAALGWSRLRTASWVHHLRRAGLVQRIEWTRSPKGQRAGRYQRVTPTP